MPLLPASGELSFFSWLSIVSHGFSLTKPQTHCDYYFKAASFTVTAVHCQRRRERLRIINHKTGLTCFNTLQIIDL